MNVNIHSVNKIQSWARGQINRAAGYIRQVSRDFASFDEEEDSASRVRERRAIVQSSDGNFFERLAGEDDADLVGILPDKYPVKDELEDDTSGDMTKGSAGKQLAERFSQFSLQPPRQKAEEQQKHTNDLYLETLYTILHKIGREMGATEEQLIRYAKAAFQVDERTHQTLMEKARREKPPILLLNVLLLEARDLIAKDIDGFSDPFVMLGIIPTTQRKSRPNEEDHQQQQAETSPQDHHPVEHNESVAATTDSNKHRSVLQRFSGSFRRKPGTRREKMEAAFETDDGIPARIIKASSVQRKTLNPKWNEKFQFVIGDVTDRFHLDIWDLDDENRSVIDVVASLNQVQGLRGLGRYFKEVTQSARSSSGDLVDDFLGSVTFSLREIPSAGIEQWFKLERRSEKSEVSGQILLKLWLSTREEQRLSSEDQRNEDFIFLDDEGLIDVQQHKDLVRQFALHEISRRGEPVCTFRGQLPDPALFILHQHAIQSDLTELHQLMCQWLAYLQMVGMGISFELLADTFSRLITRWKPMELDKDEEYVLADSLVQFGEFCRTAILKHRLRIRTRGGSSRRRSPSPKRSELESFGEMLRCYRLVRESPVFAHLVPYQKPFLTEIRELLAESARIHFDTVRANIEARAQTDKTIDGILELHLLLQALNATVERAGKFEDAFRREMPELNYAEIAYGTFDALLHEYIVSEMMSERRGDLRAIMGVCHHQQNPGQAKGSEAMATQLLAILQVHLALNEFGRHRIGARRQQYKMEQLNWADHFDRAIQRWLELALVKAFARVDLSLSLDMQNPIIVLNNDVRQTVSAMDTCHIIEQLLFVWERLKVENLLLRAELTTRIARLLCKVGKHFADQIMMRRPFDGVPSRPNEQLSQEQIDQFAAMANSCEQVRRALSCADRLRLDELGKLYEQKTRETNFRIQVEQQLDRCSQNITEQIELLIGQFVRRQTGQYKKAIFHLVWSPSACPTDECLKPLIKLLDAELSLVHRCLLHRNFTRVMYAQVQLLLKLFQECVNENIGQEPSFYRRLTDALAILLDFFHAEGKGISVESFSQSADYKHFHEQISLYQMPTEKLVELYYRELLKAQDEVTECKYGILNLRAYFNPNSELLVIDVLGAKQLIPLDSNGLSDPFVVIELLPRVHFPDQPRAKTKVVSMCLNPMFGETFEFHIPSYLPNCALVHFMVMDHDFLKSNDFAGEAFLDLNEVPGFASLQGAAGGLKQFNLVLTHPSSRATNPTIMAVLASRKEDKEAEEFIRGLSATY